MSGNVALLGAPETGKSELAIGLHGRLDGYCVIDKYAKRVSDHMDVAVGLWAPYLVNSVIATRRLQDELAAQRRGLNYISVGTVLDTIVYQSVHSSRIAVQDEHQIHRAQVMMAWLGTIMYDQWNYEHIFYLPYQGDEQIHQFYDAQLREALTLYNVPYARLDGDAEENLEEAANYITAEPVDAEAADLEELGVREGRGDSEEAGDSAEPVPGVSDEDGADRSGQLPRADWTDLQVQGD